MAHYSFKVWATDDVLFPRYFLALGPGVNVFSLFLDRLEDFVRELGSNGVTVLGTYRLDDLEEVPPTTIDLALPTGDAGGDSLLLSASTAARHDR